MRAFCYLYEEDDEKIEVGYPSELLKQVFGDKIPNCVLKEREKQSLKNTHEQGKHIQILPLLCLVVYCLGQGNS